MATRTISVAGGNWNDTGSWDEGVVPVAGDAVVARGGGDSGNLTVNVASECASIDFTNYSSTFTQNSNLTTTSTITLISGMTFSYISGTWIHNGTATITSGGKAFGAFTFSSASATITLGDDFNVDGALTISSATTVNGNNFKVGNNITVNGVLSGTTTVIFDGTGVWTGNGSAIQTSNISINTAGTLTLTGATGAVISTTTLTYTAGTIAGTGTLYLTTGSSPTLDCSGCTFPNVAFRTNGTVTLTTDLNVVNMTGGGSNCTVNGNNINISGNFSNPNGTFVGTTVFKINGSSDQTITGTDGNYVGNPVQIISTGGTVYFAGTLLMLTGGTLTYISGTVDCATNNHTLKGLGTYTLNTDGINWYNITISTTSTLTLSSNLTSTGTITISGSLTLAGAGHLYIQGHFTHTGSYTVRTGSGGGEIYFNGTQNQTWTGGATSYCATQNTGTDKWNISKTGGTLTLSGTISIGSTSAVGRLFYVQGTVSAGSSTLQTNFSVSLDTSTIAFNNVTFTGSTSTIYLYSDCNIDGTLTISGTGTKTITNYIAGNIIASGDVTLNRALTGDASITLDGTGTISSSSASYTLTNNLILNSAGIITLGINLYYLTGTITYTAGTIVNTDSTLTLSGACTLNTSGMNWNNITFSTTGTYTLSSNLSIDGTLTVNTAITITLSTSNIILSGSLTITGTGIIQGQTITLDGTGTWSHTSTGTVQSNLTINTIGTITISGTVYYNTGTLTYTTGTVITTGSTLTITNTTTLSSGNLIWNNLSTSTTGTVSLGTILKIGGLLTIGTGTTLSCAGYTVYCGGGLSRIGTLTHGNNTFNFNGNGTISGSTIFYNFTCDTSDVTLTFTAGTTQTVSNNLIFDGIVDHPVVLVSSNPTNHWNLKWDGSVSTINYCSVTDCDASSGTQIVATDGTNIDGGNNHNWLFTLALGYAYFMIMG